MDPFCDDIYFTSSHAIMSYNPNTRIMKRLAGKENVKGYSDGIGEEALFNDPFGLAVDFSGIFVADK